MVGDDPFPSLNSMGISLTSLGCETNGSFRSPNAKGISLLSLAKEPNGAQLHNSDILSNKLLPKFGPRGENASKFLLAAEKIDEAASLDCWWAISIMSVSSFWGTARALNTGKWMCESHVRERNMEHQKYSMLRKHEDQKKKKDSTDMVRSPSLKCASTASLRSPPCSWIPKRLTLNNTEKWTPKTQFFSRNNN